MKKHLTLFLTTAVLATAALTGCAFKMPEGDTKVVHVDPDFSAPSKLNIDFTELHNDTLGSFDEESAAAYMFIRDVNISGDMGKKIITVEATAIEGATEEDAKHFAAAVLSYMADAATEQYSPYEASTEKAFGSLYKDFAIDFLVKDPEGKEIYHLEVPAGGEIPLDPDFQKYEDEWRRTMEIYQDNVVYGADGKPVSE